MNKTYHDIHKWLIKTYGKATKCSGTDCKGLSKKYEWALIKGLSYEMNKDNFIDLCASCHRQYDMTEETRLKHREKMLGSRHTPERIENIRKSKQKQIQQVDLKTGEVLGTYSSILEASRATGVKNNSIGQCAKGHPKYNHAGGFKWLYLKKEGLI